MMDWCSVLEDVVKQYEQHTNTSEKIQCTAPVHKKRLAGGKTGLQRTDQAGVLADVDKLQYRFRIDFRVTVNYHMF